MTLSSFQRFGFQSHVTWLTMLPFFRQACRYFYKLHAYLSVLATNHVDMQPDTQRECRQNLKKHTPPALPVTTCWKGQARHVALNDQFDTSNTIAS